MINNSRYVSDSTLGVCYGNSLQIQLVWCWSGFFFFFSEFIMGVYTFLKKGPLSQIKTSVMLRNRQAFHLPILLCNSEHVAEINETVKSRVCVWVVFCFFCFLIHWASQCFTCRLIKRLTVMFIKMWMVTLFEMTNSLLYIMRSVKHPEKKCIIW